MHAASKMYMYSFNICMHRWVRGWTPRRNLHWVQEESLSQPLRDSPQAESVLLNTEQILTLNWAGTRKVKPGRKTQSRFTGTRDSEWQRHQLGHLQICTLTQTHNHAGITPLSFLQAGCHFCHPTNSVKALKAVYCAIHLHKCYMFHHSSMS